MKVAFIGLGTMGLPMAGNIQKNGHELTVYNRTKGKEACLAEDGAACADTPGDAAAAAEVIITCVSDTPDLEAVVLGDEGILAGARPGSVLVDMSTVSPAKTRELAALCKEKGVGMIDAPVSGGSEGAERATLTVMAGGEEKDLEKVLPVLKTMAASITLVGPSGAGQLTKAVNQIVVAGSYLAVAEGMAFGLKAGLDMEKVVQAIKGGSAGSWVMDYRSDNMINNRYPLGFKVSLHNKDLGIALKAAKEMGVSLPMTALIEQMENGLMARGFGDEDLSALARTLRHDAGIDD